MINVVEYLENLENYLGIRIGPDDILNYDNKYYFVWRRGETEVRCSEDETIENVAGMLEELFFRRL